MYQRKPNSWVKHYDFILWDLICLQAAFILAYLIRHGNLNVYKIDLYRDMGLFFVLVDCVIIFINNTFKNVLKRGSYIEFKETVKHTFAVTMLSLLYLFSIQKGTDYSRIVLYITWALYFVLSYVVRVWWKYFLMKRMDIVEKRSLLLVTSTGLVEETLENYKRNNFGRHAICGICLADQNLVGEKIHEIPVVATTESVAQYVCREWVDEVFVNIDPKVPYSRDLIDKLMETGVTVHINLAKISKQEGKRQFVEKMGDYTVLTTSINYMTTREALAKRVLDIAGALVGCFITVLIFIFIGPIIYIASPGPIIFKQTRVGQNGKLFQVYKFRSMYLDAEERKKALMEQNRVKDGFMFKLDFDPRIIGNRILPSGEKKTGIGEFIRKTSLDEFPQFFNVLKGDMSLVGTRPPTVDEWEKYELHHRARLATRPGITGMWQVSGRSNITDFEEVVQLDTKYINEWSMGLDFKILFKTVLQVIKQDGSM